MSAELYLDDSEIGQFERAATCTAWSVLSWGLLAGSGMSQKIKYNHHTNS